jgi:uncharacterized protein YeaO (DUF488 family)
MAKIKCKRIYEESSEDDGVRVLVDRLWPRGVSKEIAKLDYWLKEVAPSNELRKWYHHDVTKFNEFKNRYKQELSQEEQKEALEQLCNVVSKGKNSVTLLYGAKDEKINQAVILKEILEDKYHRKNGKK